MKRDLLMLSVLSVVSSLVIWVIFSWGGSFWGIRLQDGGVGVIKRNYDGLLYVVVSKSWYKPDKIARFEFGLGSNYYPAHFPLYPLFISLISLILLDSTWAALVATLLSSVGAVIVFYLMAREATKHALWLSAIFLFFPARYLVVRSIASPEPLFLLLLMLSVWNFAKGKYWISGLAGGLAVLTKSPGILLAPAYFIAIIAGQWRGRLDLKALTTRYFGLVLIPLSLVGLFAYFQMRTGDFWAYFHTGDNIHLRFPPFSIFNAGDTWVGSHWLEDVVWLYVWGIVGLMALWSEKRVAMASFAGVVLVTILFVSHRDVSRYALPMAPFLLLGMGKWLVNLKNKAWLWVFLVPIFLYSINFINNNSQVVSDWSLLR